jgi:acyl transferase domain-containing protein
VLFNSSQLSLTLFNSLNSQANTEKELAELDNSLIDYKCSPKLQVPIHWNRAVSRVQSRGPSKAVDTACSSASVALHDAILALRAGDADQILVGGSNLILDPDKMSIISSMS